MSEATHTVGWTVDTQLAESSANDVPESTPENDMVVAFSAAMGLYDRELSPTFLFAHGRA